MCAPLISSHDLNLAGTLDEDHIFNEESQTKQLLLFFFSFEELNIDIHLQGGEVCVSCESKASRPHLGDRCSGHGVDGKMTRWSWKDGARKDEKWAKILLLLVQSVLTISSIQIFLSSKS